MIESKLTSQNISKLGPYNRNRAFPKRVNIPLALSIFPLFLVVLLLVINIIISLKNDRFFPKDQMSISVLATICVAFFGLLFGYSFLVNLILGTFSIIALILSIFLQTQIKSKTNLLSKRILAAIIISILSLLYVIFSIFDTKLDLYQCKRHTGLSLPPNTRLLFIHPLLHFSGPEVGLYIKATMDRKEIPMFLQRPPMSVELLSNELTPNDFYSSNPFDAFIASETFGWNPKSLKNSWGMHWQKDTAYGDVLIDLEDPEKAVVYLFFIYY